MTEVENTGFIYLKHKSEAVQKFIEFHKLMKNTYNYKIKEVRSDHDLEYNNSNFYKLS